MTQRNPDKSNSERHKVQLGRRAKLEEPIHRLLSGPEFQDDIKAWRKQFGVKVKQSVEIEELVKIDERGQRWLTMPDLNKYLKLPDSRIDLPKAKARWRELWEQMRALGTSNREESLRIADEMNGLLDVLSITTAIQKSLESTFFSTAIDTG